jgi:hypothetical protein
MSDTPFSHKLTDESTEQEVIAAYRAMLEARFPLPEGSTESRINEWRKECRDKPARGLFIDRCRQDVLIKAEQLHTEGTKLEDALRDACEIYEYKYISSSKSDIVNWKNRLLQSYHERKQHKHALLDAYITYTDEHLALAMLHQLPEIVGAIFITGKLKLRRIIVQRVNRFRL